MSRDDNADDKESKKSLLSTIRSLIRRSLIRRFEDDTGQPREVSWSIYQGFAIVVGVIIVTFYAAHGTTPWKSSAIGLLIAGAALAAGVLIGFLFGIPRTQQKEGQKSDPTIGSQPGAADAYGVNTNLEQISDWLTKIIVGVGLVQLTVIPGKLRGLADYLATAFGTQVVPSAMVITIICYFGIFGFLLGYLWTRIYLTREFSRIERITRDKPEYYEGLIHAYLYQPKPGGFKNAIKEGLKYLDRFGDNERVWTYLACAYGQELSYSSNDPHPNQEAKDKSRKNGFDAVMHVLQINPAAKEFLSRLWDPNKTTPGEDDLRSFYDFEEFKKVLA